MPEKPQPVLVKNDRKARTIIISLSVIVFLAILLLGRYSVDVNLPFNPHIFAFINATLNTGVALLLLLALFAVKSKKYLRHRNLMIAAMSLSVLFLMSYICHHLFTDPTSYTSENKTAKTIYYILLGTHIPLAGLILPSILFTAYRGLTADYSRHTKLARITWPVWFYVAVSGVIIYWMIRPFYPA